MPALRTIREEEVGEVAAFDRNYGGGGLSTAEFRETYQSYPELFVAYVEDEEVIAEAFGRRMHETETGGDPAETVVLQSIAVRADRREEGLGSIVLAYFEGKARRYGSRISAASAANVEGFYRRCGYEPSSILLQVDEDDVPLDYEELDRITDERTPEDGVRFLYADAAGYDPGLREELAARTNAFEANTIYAKRIED